MRLSIIIPAYKVEDFIERCIRSLEQQDLPKSDYEIIVTNDGSPDDCQAIVERLQKEFSNIILINQENQGVSMARNNAIAIAKGKYILPIDPDDYVVPNTFRSVLAVAENDDLDILYLGFEIFDSAHKSVWQTNYVQHKNKTYSGVEGYFKSRGNAVRDPDRSWAILYKKAMLDKFAINYPKDVPYLEDGLFLAKVFSVAERVGFDSRMFYQRTTREGSATNSRLFLSEKSTQGFINAVQDVKVFRNRNDFNQEQQKLINHVVTKFVILSLSPSITTFDFKSYFKVIAILKDSGIQKLTTQGLRMSYLRHARVYNFSKILFPFYFRFINILNFYFKGKT
jgi:glycosyltransferase involved in cell wall biosynthesis